MDDKGKERKKYHYDKMMTPYEKLKSLKQSENYLKEFLSFEQLDKDAYQMSDNKFTDRMNLAKKQLFKQINEQKKNLIFRIGINGLSDSFVNWKILPFEKA